MPNDFPHYWTYEGVRLEDLPREDLLEACETACEEVHRLRKELGYWMKQAALGYAEPSGHA